MHSGPLVSFTTKPQDSFLFLCDHLTILSVSDNISDNILDLMQGDVVMVSNNRVGPIGYTSNMRWCSQESLVNNWSYGDTKPGFSNPKMLEGGNSSTVGSPAESHTGGIMTVV